jgi:hypothetical protein
MPPTEMPPIEALAAGQGQGRLGQVTASSSVGTDYTVNSTRKTKPGHAVQYGSTVWD